ncbi:MAG: hypothetical protein K8I27_05705 [Planctomycetes bacterium]|nr:hypothetical protein [Planctomycetota bacterium]
MNDPREKYLEAALDELYLGGPDDELADKVIASNRPPDLRLVKDTPARRRRWLWLQAACAVIALGLIALVLAPRENELPGVIAHGEFERVGDEIELNAGWYVLDTGAPAVTSDGTRIEQVAGRVLVKVGEIPDENELHAQREWLRQNGVEETDMNWIKTGGLAVCLLFGSAVIDGQPVFAQEKERKRVAELERELEKAREDLERAEREARGGEEDGFSAERAERDLTRLRKELKDVDRKIEFNNERLEHEENEEKIEELERQQKELEAHAEHLEREIAGIELTMEIHGMEREIREHEEALEELRSELRREPENGELRQEVREHEEALEELRGELEGLHEELEELWGEEETEKDPIDGLEQMIDRLEEELEGLREAPEENADRIRSKERTLKSLRTAVEALHEAEREEMRAELANVRKELDVSLVELKRLLDERKNAARGGESDRAEELKDEINELEDHIRGLREDLENLEREVRETEEEEED